MASPQERDLLVHDTAAAKPGAPDLTAQGSFAAKQSPQADKRLPVVASAADNGDGEGAIAAPGSTAKASLVHSAGLKHPIVEVMVTSHAGGRVLLRRRPADDPLAADTWDVSVSTHLAPADGGDALSAAKRALDGAGLAIAEGTNLKPLPERRERLDFPVGGFVENVVVHPFTLEVDGEEQSAGGGGGGGGGAAAAKTTTTKGPDGAERTWLPKEDALRMLSEDPAVCSPFLMAGKKAWFA